MNHEIILEQEATLDADTGHVVFNVAHSPPAALALGLALVNEDLLDTLVIRPANAGWVLRVRTSSTPRDIRMQWYATKRLEVRLGQIELERWLVFFLKYYRDGWAEVDHLDSEATWDTGQPCDLTLKVANSAPPVSEDEARRRLGLR